MEDKQLYDEIIYDLLSELDLAKLKEDVETYDRVSYRLCDCHAYNRKRNYSKEKNFNLGLASKYNKFILKWLIKKVIPGAIVTINKEIRSHKLIINCRDWYGFETNELEKYLNPNCNYKEINDEIFLWLKEQVIEYFKLEDMMGRRASKIRFSSILGTDIKDLKELISEYAPEFKGRFQIRK